MFHPCRLLLWCVALGGALGSAWASVPEAPLARADWLQASLYADHHPWAAQAPEELATKMDKMRADRTAFTFLRGTAPLFYRDMARLPPAVALNPRVLLNGDAHLGNFGCFADGAGRVIFALNDFDEAAEGPAAWDLRRLATSLVLVGRGAKLDEADIAAALDALVEAYLTRLAAFAKGEPVRAFHLDEAVAQGEVRDCLDKAARQSRAKWLDKSSRVKDGQRHFRDDKLLRALAPARETALAQAVADYAKGMVQPAPFFRVKDVRQKLGSGVGSLGRLRYWVLVEGETAGPDDDRILELKQAAAPASRFARTGAGGAAAEAARVVAALRAQLSQPDPLAGVLRLEGADYVLRERPAQQEDFDVDELDSRKKLTQAAAQAGAALAHAHALPKPATLGALAGQDLRQSQTELRRFAFDYADQVMQDWRDFKDMKPARLY